MDERIKKAFDFAADLNRGVPQLRKQREVVNALRLGPSAAHFKRDYFS
jgi:hypothetical protein